MSALLTVQGLEAGYAASQVLFGIDFSVSEGEVVTLLGRNGMGKSTFVKCLSGLVVPRAGSIHLGGVDLSHGPAYRNARAGIGLVPEGRHVFPTLTVRENLIATAATVNGKAWNLARVEALFPRLGERADQHAGKLSGGEQQMLAIGRALMTNPKLLILDEATEGLAPLVRHEIWACLNTLKSEGLAMLVIDKNLAALMPLANQHVIFEKGRVVWKGDSAELAAAKDVAHRYIGV